MEPVSLFHGVVNAMTWRALTSLLLFACVASPAAAQVDLSGTWSVRMHEDWMERWPGPDPGDFTGLPLNEDGKAWAQSYSPSQLSMPERQCLYYPQTYRVVGPFAPRIWPEAAPGAGIIAWRMSGAVDMSPRTIWMDGRPHPPTTAPHTNEGFSTGVWRGRMLVVTTTHMKAGPLRRNGAFTSDNATMTEYFVRHGDLLTVTAFIEDPATLAEPHVISRTFVHDPAINTQVYGNPCVPGIEAPGLAAGEVPHYLPGTNPFVPEFAMLYNLPQEVVLGGADTLYPEFREKLRAIYKRPPVCGRYCCGWGGGNSGVAGQGDAPNLKCITAP
jgi:hypothetical protein